MEIIADPQLRQYELTYLIPTTLSASEQETVIKEITESVTKRKGNVVASDDWGVKPLAYTIKHNGKRHKDARYVHLVVEVLPENVGAIDKDLRLHSYVIRHLLVIAETVASTPAQPEEEK